VGGRDFFESGGIDGCVRVAFAIASRIPCSDAEVLFGSLFEHGSSFTGTSLFAPFAVFCGEVFYSRSCALPLAVIWLLAELICTALLSWTEGVLGCGKFARYKKIGFGSLFLALGTFLAGFVGRGVFSGAR